jgi:hypothetical protein
MISSMTKSAADIENAIRHLESSFEVRQLQELFYWCVSDCDVNQGATLKPRD